MKDVTGNNRNVLRDQHPSAIDQDGVIPVAPGLAYLTFSNAAVVTVKDTRTFFSNPDAQPIKKKIGETEYEIIPWGASNDEPNLIIPKIGKSVDMSSNMLFNISAGYGSGIIPVRIKIKDATGYELNMAYEPVLDNDDINQFFEDNDIEGYWLEQITDMNWFFNTFPEVILNMEAPAKRKIVELRSKEATFSRWGKMDDMGNINKHFYSAYWNEPNSLQTNKDPKNPDAITVTDVLDSHNPILDLKRRIGRSPRPDASTKDDSVFRYIMPVNFPTPGRSYYQKPYWHAIIESGWYDFTLLIPEAKKALMDNKMMVNYIVYIHEKYFEWIFQKEGITKDEDKKARITKEYADINTFLAGAKNQGKAIIARMMYSPDGKEIPAIVIKPIDNPIKGGEYIDDSEEASNILAYGQGVHSSIIGSHGKAGTINGSEARELFTIKQAMMRPFRDRLLKPLYLVKAINNWPKDIRFICPNMQLTTLDKGTGAVKNTGGPA